MSQLPSARSKPLLSPPTKHALVAGGLALLGVLYWFPALGEFFAQDDFLFLEAAKFRHTTWTAMFRALFDVGPVDNGYRPLSTTFYFFVMHRTFGLDPLPYHTVSLLAHIAISVMVYLLTFTLMRDRVLAVLAGVFFLTRSTAFVPLHWACLVQDLFACLFLMLSVLIVLRYLRSGEKLALAGAAVAFAMALLSKEVPITLPAAIPLIAWAASRHNVTITIRRTLVVTITLGVVSVLYYALRYYATIKEPSAYALTPPSWSHVTKLVYHFMYGNTGIHWPFYYTMVIGFFAVIAMSLANEVRRMIRGQSRFDGRALALMLCGLVIALPPVSLGHRWVPYYSYIPMTLWIISLFAAAMSLLPQSRLPRQVGYILLIAAVATSAAIEYRLNWRKTQPQWIVTFTGENNQRPDISVAPNPNYMITGGWLHNEGSVATMRLYNEVLDQPRWRQRPPRAFVLVGAGTVDMFVGSNTRPELHKYVQISSFETMLRLYLDAPKLEARIISPNEYIAHEYVAWHYHLMPDELTEFIHENERDVVVVFMLPLGGTIMLSVEADQVSDEELNTLMSDFLRLFEELRVITRR